MAQGGSRQDSKKLWNSGYILKVEPIDLLMDWGLDMGCEK